MKNRFGWMSVFSQNNVNQMSMADRENAETVYIQQRRQAAGQSQSDATTGLALSGGGIRSASFNLGFVQGLMDAGWFKQIDYLSTVSGGGYLGGFLGAQLAQSRAPDGLEPPEDPLKSIIVSETGEQPAQVKRLLRSGRYLKSVPRFLNRYFFGLIVLNMWIFCGMAALGAGTAWLFRWIDWRPVIHFAVAAGFTSDIARAFMPASAFLVLWLLVWCLRYMWQWMVRQEDTPQFDIASRVLAMVTIALTVLGFVSILVTEDLAMATWSGFTPTLNRITQAMAFVLVSLQLLAMIPAIRLDRLVQSGARPRGTGDRIIFAVIGPALVFGIPLLSFGFFAREDVSGLIKDARVKDFPMRSETNPSNFELTRCDPRRLSQAHIADWPRFWRLIKERASEDDANQNEKVRSLHTWNAMLADAASTKDADLLEVEDANESDKRVTRIERIVLQAAERTQVDYGAVLESSIDNAERYRDMLAGHGPLIGAAEFFTIWNLRWERDDLQSQVVEQINLALENADFIPGNVDLALAADRQRAQDLAARAKSSGEEDLWDRAAVRQLNRDFLQAYFGEQMLRPPGTVFALTTHEVDQDYRVRSFFIFAMGCFLLGWVISPNSTSLHEFYRDRLRRMWIMGEGEASNVIRMSTLDQPDTGTRHTFPFLIVNATANLFQGQAGSLAEFQAQAGPLQARFEFTPTHCGYSYRDFQDEEVCRCEQTKEFEQQLHLDLAGVVAISGSAISPVMTTNFVLKSLLFLTNVRLGQWVRQPASKPTIKYPCLARCLWSAFVCGNNRSPFVFLSDGGHYDNLGIEALLERRAQTIVCVDAGYDPDSRFTDFLKVVRRSRFIKGIQIVTCSGDYLEFAEIEKLKGKIARAHFLTAQVRYPCGKVGELTLVKPSFDMDEPAELINYRDENPDFPHDPTLDQFYDERRFESYRALGWHIAKKWMERKKSPHLDTSTVPSRLLALSSTISSSAAESAEKLWELKEELIERRQSEMALSADERGAIIRALTNYLERSDREAWEDVVLFDCITDLLDTEDCENNELETMFAAMSEDPRLSAYTEHLVRWRRKRAARRHSRSGVREL